MDFIRAIEATWFRQKTELLEFKQCPWSAVRGRMLARESGLLTYTLGITPERGPA
jgi:hypothetical protein